MQTRNGVVEVLDLEGEVHEIFLNVYGTACRKTAQFNQLFAVRDALGLQNNDALWLVLMALEHYRDLYEHQFREPV